MDGTNERGTSTSTSAPLIDLTTQATSPSSLSGTLRSQQLSPYAPTTQTDKNTVVSIHSTAAPTGTATDSSTSSPGSSAHKTTLATSVSSFVLSAAAASPLVVTKPSHSSHSSQEQPAKLSSRKIPPALVDYGDMATISEEPGCEAKEKAKPQEVQCGTNFPVYVSTLPQDKVGTLEQSTFKADQVLVNSSPSAALPSDTSVCPSQVSRASLTPLNIDFPHPRSNCPAMEEVNLGAQKVHGNGTEGEATDEEERESFGELRIEEQILETPTSSDTEQPPPAKLRRVMMADGVHRMARVSTQAEEKMETDSHVHVDSLPIEPSPAVPHGAATTAEKMPPTRERWTEMQSFVHDGEARSPASENVRTGMSSLNGVAQTGTQLIRESGRVSSNPNLQQSVLVHKEMNSSLERISSTTAAPSSASSSSSSSSRESEKFAVREQGERGRMAAEAMNSSAANLNGEVIARVRKVAKVKQFFTTLQHFGNKRSTEVAEQVQELIAALVVSR